MFKLACGTRGCWPLIVTSSEKSVTEKSAETITSASIESVQHQMNIEFIITAIVIITLLATIVTLLVKYRRTKIENEKCKREYNEILKSVITSTQWFTATRSI